MKKTLLISGLLISNLIAFGQQRFYCSRDYEKQDSMSRAWYPFQIVDSIKYPNSKTFILANPQVRPKDFVSSEEKIYKELANASNKISKILNSQIVVDSMLIISAQWNSSALKENQFANNMDMAVWIQNQTNDTILFPNQDGSLIGILEALYQNNNWKPIQYWWFSWCGESYSTLILPPKHSIQIGLNNKLGEINTKMRLKIHGQDTIYYSNEFAGTISKDNFRINNIAELEMIKDKYRISFLDSVHYGLIDEPELNIKIIEPNE